MIFYAESKGLDLPITRCDDGGELVKLLPLAANGGRDSHRRDQQRDPAGQESRPRSHQRPFLRSRLPTHDSRSHVPTDKLIVTRGLCPPRIFDRLLASSAIWVFMLSI